MTHIITLPTDGPGLYEFTERVTPLAKGDGVLTLFVRHTSCSLLIQENADPEVQSDLQAFFHRLVPPTSDPSMSYLTHTYEGPDDMPARIKAAMLPVSLSIPSFPDVFASVRGKAFTFSNIGRGHTSATSPLPWLQVRSEARTHP